MEEYQDFAEFIKLLNEHKVEYLIVGGYAVTFHSRPRFTEDLDIWINPSKTNSKKAFKVLEAFGFGKFELKQSELQKEDFVLQIGYRPVRIDLMTSIEGVRFRDAFSKKETGLFYKGLKANYLNLDDLLMNKQITGRRKDKEALEWIKESNKRIKI